MTVRAVMLRAEREERERRADALRPVTIQNLDGLSQECLFLRKLSNKPGFDQHRPATIRLRGRTKSLFEAHGSTSHKEAEPPTVFVAVMEWWRDGWDRGWWENEEDR